MNNSPNIAYLSSTEWGNLGRRKVRLGYEFARRPEVAALLYVNPPVDTSVLDLLRNRYMDSHLPACRAAQARAVFGRTQPIDAKLSVLTASTKTLPLTKRERLRRSHTLLNVNRSFYRSAMRRQISRIPGRRTLLWLNHPLQVDALAWFDDAAITVFDWTDDWTQYSQLPVADRAELEAATEHILTSVDLVMAVSDSLRSRAAEVNPHVHLLPNATDYALLSPAHDADTVVAEDLRDLPQPRIGYIGQIGENIDYELIAAVATLRPDWSFVFVGPIWSTREDEIDALSNHPNVHFLGGRPHSELVSYLAGFDLCWMPHLLNPLTESMDPTKLYDYFASGKPIVSTSVAGTERFRSLIHLADSASEMAALMTTALEEDGTCAARRLACAKENSWPQRAEIAWSIIQTYWEKKAQPVIG